jgi:hypothetical protein
VHGEATGSIAVTFFGSPTQCLPPMHNSVGVALRRCLTGAAPRPAPAISVVLRAVRLGPMRATRAFLPGGRQCRWR